MGQLQYSGRDLSRDTEDLDPCHGCLYNSEEFTHPLWVLIS